MVINAAVAGMQSAAAARKVACLETMSQNAHQRRCTGITERIVSVIAAEASAESPLADGPNPIAAMTGLMIPAVLPCSASAT
jgi:hypothetical protein